MAAKAGWQRASISIIFVAAAGRDEDCPVRGAHLAGRSAGLTVRARRWRPKPADGWRNRLADDGRRAACDYVIDERWPTDKLRAQVDRIWPELKAAAAAD